MLGARERAASANELRPVDSDLLLRGRYRGLIGGHSLHRARAGTGTGSGAGTRRASGRAGRRGRTPVAAAPAGVRACAAFAPAQSPALQARSLQAAGQPRASARPDAAPARPRRKHARGLLLRGLLQVGRGGSGRDRDRPRAGVAKRAAHGRLRGERTAHHRHQPGRCAVVDDTATPGRLARERIADCDQHTDEEREHRSHSPAAAGARGRAAAGRRSRRR